MEMAPGASEGIPLAGRAVAEASEPVQAGGEGGRSVAEDNANTLPSDEPNLSQIAARRRFSPPRRSSHRCACSKGHVAPFPRHCFLARLRQQRALLARFGVVPAAAAVACRFPGRILERPCRMKHGRPEGTLEAAHWKEPRQGDAPKEPHHDSMAVDPHDTGEPARLQRLRPPPHRLPPGHADVLPEGVRPGRVRLRI
jgi:hypothetical protein